MTKVNKKERKSNFPSFTNYLNKAELKEYQPFIELFKIYSPYECYCAIYDAIMFIPDYRDEEDFIVTIDVMNAHDVCKNLLEIQGIILGWNINFSNDLRNNFKQMCGDSVNLNYSFIHTLEKATIGLIKFQTISSIVEVDKVKVLFAIRNAYLKIFALHNGVKLSEYEH